MDPLFVAVIILIVAPAVVLLANHLHKTLTVEHAHRAMVPRQRPATQYPSNHEIRVNERQLDRRAINLTHHPIGRDNCDGWMSEACLDCSDYKVCEREAT